MADAFAGYVADDATLRITVEHAPSGQLGTAVAFDTGRARADFENYIAALRSTLTDKESAFAAATVSGQRALGPWQWLPAVWASVIAALVLLGFAPRLREYR